MDHIEETAHQAARGVEGGIEAQGVEAPHGERDGGGRPPDGRDARPRDAVARTAETPDAAAGVIHVNEIVLVGRLSGAPEWKALPEGREVAVWRLIVEHQNARSPQDAIDTIRCVTYDSAVQEGIRGWRHGDLIEVRGSLRHRFWRAPNGPRGLYEVEAAIAVRHDRAASRPGDRT
ncbi:single-stranded DNA-binding protein [Actinoallomurus sp. CA-150999]|uniref:single-stranded DNA-binding protein n=1 Tax=Actinoallomurus sp. CA-150999 TaxID=3239887 RepID=UPI003D8CD0D5